MMGEEIDGTGKDRDDGVHLWKASTKDDALRQMLNYIANNQTLRGQNQVITGCYYKRCNSLRPSARIWCHARLSPYSTASSQILGSCFFHTWYDAPDKRGHRQKGKISIFRTCSLGSASTSWQGRFEGWNLRARLVVGAAITFNYPLSLADLIYRNARWSLPMVGWKMRDVISINEAPLYLWMQNFRSAQLHYCVNFLRPATKY